MQDENAQGVMVRVAQGIVENQELPKRWVSSRLEGKVLPIVPDEHRQPRDWACFYIFVGLVGVILVLSVVLLAVGHIQSLFRPFDSDIKECGAEVRGYPYLYYVSPHDLTRSVCVKECPTDEDKPLECSPNSVVTSCRRDIRDHFNLSNQVLVYESQLHFDRICLPVSRHLDDIVDSSVNFQGVSVLEAIRHLWPMLIVIPLVNILLNLIFYYLLHMWPVTVLASLIVLWFASLITLLVLNILAPKNFLVIFYIVISGIALLISTFFLAGNLRYKEVVREVVKCATEQVFTHKWVIFVHPIRSLLTLLYMVLWIFILFAIISLGSSESEAARKGILHFEMNGLVAFLLMLHVFIFFWVYGVLNNVAAYLVCGSAVTWFF
jgi:hypothetical protein